MKIKHEKAGRRFTGRERSQIITFARVWAELIEDHLVGNSFEVALAQTKRQTERAMKQTGRGEITDEMFIAVVAILGVAWRHGTKLRDYYMLRLKLKRSDLRPIELDFEDFQLWS